MLWLILHKSFYRETATKVKVIVDIPFPEYIFDLSPEQIVELELPDTYCSPTLMIRSTFVNIMLHTSSKLGLSVESWRKMKKHATTSFMGCTMSKILLQRILTYSIGISIHPGKISMNATLVLTAFYMHNLAPIVYVSK